MSKEELQEVVEYLKHPNPSVRQEACKILTQLCTSPSTFTTLASLDPVPLLLPLISSPPPLQSSTLTLLLLLSTSEPFIPVLLSHPTLSTLIELLRTSPSPPPSSTPPALSLLVNLTREERGAQQLMQEGTALEGLHLRRLLSWFLLPPFPNDPYQHVASLLLNVSQLPSGRRWLLSPQLGALASLPAYVLSESEVRQRDVLTMFRNLFLEAVSHPLLLAPSCPLLQHVLLLIAGEGEVREEEREGFFPAVLQAMDASHARHPDPAIRRLCLEIITLCAREKKSRAYLKERRVYPVLRELHQKHEKGERGDAELDAMLYDIVPYLILPEDQQEYEEEVARMRQKAAAAAAEAKRAEGEERKEPPQPPRQLPAMRQLVPLKAGEAVEDEEADEKTAALLADLSVASSAVEGEVQQKRAERESAERDKRQRQADVQRQMEARERVDEALEEGEEDGDDDLPDLIEEPAGGSIDDMD